MAPVLSILKTLLLGESFRCLFLCMYLSNFKKLMGCSLHQHKNINLLFLTNFAGLVANFMPEKPRKCSLRQHKNIDQRFVTNLVCFKPNIWYNHELYLHLKLHWSIERNKSQLFKKLHLDIKKLEIMKISSNLFLNSLPKSCGNERSTGIGKKIRSVNFCSVIGLLFGKFYSSNFAPETKQLLFKIETGYACIISSRLLYNFQL